MQASFTQSRTMRVSSGPSAHLRPDSPATRGRPRNMEDRHENRKRVCVAGWSESALTDAPAESPALSRITAGTYSESKDTQQNLQNLRRTVTSSGPVDGADGNVSAGSHSTNHMPRTNAASRSGSSSVTSKLSPYSQASPSQPLSSSVTSCAVLVEGESPTSLASASGSNDHSNPKSAGNSRRNHSNTLASSSSEAGYSVGRAKLSPSWSLSTASPSEDSAISRIVSRSPFQTAQRLVERMIRQCPMRTKGPAGDILAEEAEHTGVFMHLVSVVSQLKACGLTPSDILLLTKSALGVLKDPVFSFLDSPQAVGMEHTENADPNLQTEHATNRKMSKPLPSTLSINDEIADNKAKFNDLPSLSSNAALSVHQQTARATNATPSDQAQVLTTAGDRQWIQELCVRLPSSNASYYRELGVRFARAAQLYRNASVLDSAAHSERGTPLQNARAEAGDNDSSHLRRSSVAWEARPHPTNEGATPLTMSSCTTTLSQQSSATITPKVRSSQKAVPQTPSLCVTASRNTDPFTRPSDSKSATLGQREDRSVNMPNFSALISMGIPGSAAQQLRGFGGWSGLDSRERPAHYKPGETASKRGDSTLPSESAIPPIREPTNIPESISKLLASPQSVTQDETKFFTTLEPYTAVPLDVVPYVPRTAIGNSSGEKSDATPAPSPYVVPAPRLDIGNTRRDQLSFTPTPDARNFTPGPYTLYYRVNQADPVMMAAATATTATTHGSSTTTSENQGFLKEMFTETLHCVPLHLNAITTMEHDMIAPLEANPAVSSSSEGPGLLLNVPMTEYGLLHQNGYPIDPVEHPSVEPKELPIREASRRIPRYTVKVLEPIDETNHSETIDHDSASPLAPTPGENQYPRPNRTSSNAISERKRSRPPSQKRGGDEKKASDRPEARREGEATRGEGISSVISDKTASDIKSCSESKPQTNTNEDQASETCESTTAINSVPQQSLNIIISDNDPVVMYLMELRLSALDGLLQLIKPLSQLPRKFHVEEQFIAWWPVDVPKKHVSKLSKRDKVSVIVAIMRSFAEGVKPEEFLEHMTQRIRSSLETSEMLREYIEKMLAALFRYPVYIYPEHEGISPSSIVAFRKLRRRLLPELHRASGLGYNKYSFDELISETNSTNGNDSSDQSSEGDSSEYESPTTAERPNGESDKSEDGDTLLARRQTRSATIRGRLRQ